jgi:hypothetical protein
MNEFAPMKIQIQVSPESDHTQLSITGIPVTGQFGDYRADAEALFELLMEHAPSETVYQLLLLLNEEPPHSAR